LSKVLVSSAVALIAFSVVSLSLAEPPLVEQKIRDFHSIKPDCSTTGTVKVRIIDPPANGRIEIRQGLDFPLFGSTNPRSACRMQRVPTTQVWYVPNPGFGGADRATFEALYPSGQVRRVVWQYRQVVNGRDGPPVRPKYGKVFDDHHLWVCSSCMGWAASWVPPSRIAQQRSRGQGDALQIELLRRSAEGID